MQPESTPPDGEAIAQQLATLDQASLVALLRELCDRSMENHVFLAIRLLGHPDGGSVLEHYRQRIDDVFFPADADPAAIPDAARIGDMRLLILQYHQATDDMVGAIDLMLTFAEDGTHLLWHYQDIGDDYNDQVDQSYHDLASLVRRSDDMDTYMRFQERLLALARKSEAIGWLYRGTAYLYELMGDIEWADDDEA
jgi:hypothetical protein